MVSGTRGYGEWGAEKLFVPPQCVLLASPQAGTEGCRGQFPAPGAGGTGLYGLWTYSQEPSFEASLGEQGPERALGWGAIPSWGGEVASRTPVP